MKYKIRLARPCVDDPKKYVAESHLGCEVDIERLCRVLETLPVRDVRCSPRLGVARFEFDERSVMIYQNGRVDLRRTTSAEDAEDTIERVVELIGECFKK
jgi:ArsR family metal-binding transcriptional regulator